MTQYIAPGPFFAPYTERKNEYAEEHKLKRDKICCKYYCMGHCKFGKKCHYRHAISPQSLQYDHLVGIEKRLQSMEQKIINAVRNMINGANKNENDATESNEFFNLKKKLKNTEMMLKQATSRLNDEETERKKIICVNPYENELTLLKKKLKNTEMRLRNAVLRINQDKASEQKQPRNYNKQETVRNYEKQPRNHNEAELSEHTQPRNYAKLVNEMKDINKRLGYKWHELNKQLTTNKYFLQQIRSHQKDIDHQEKVIHNVLKAFFDEENDAGNDEDENKIIRNTRYVGSDQQKAMDDMLLSEQHDESPKDSDEEMEKWKKLIASEIRNDELIYSEQHKPRNDEDDAPKLTHIPNVYATKELITVDPVVARKKDLEEKEMHGKKWIKEMKNGDNDDNKDNDDEHSEESECIENDKDCIEYDKDDYKEATENENE